MFRERRQRLLKALGAGVAVFPANRVAVRNNDVEHEFRQDSDVFYLTGLDEPEVVLVLTNCHPEHHTIAFLRVRDPEREQWDGPRLGVEEAARSLGVDVAHPIGELAERLPGYLKGASRLHYRLGRDRSFDDVVLSAIDLVRRKSRDGAGPPTEIVDPCLTLHEHRLRKTTDEIAIMRRAAAASREGHARALAATRPGAWEYEIEGVLLGAFRESGGRPAYSCIVGSGLNATVLHYRANNRQMKDGDLLLIDAGCEIDCYASDVTRTFPVSGRFTTAQRRLYDIVLASQEAAIASVHPGQTIDGVHAVAVDVLARGMLDVGLIKGSFDEVIEKKLYRPYYMHRTSHWLGLDVHDVGAYHVDGKCRPFEPGFVLTVEPGIYIAADAAVDAQWRGIGIRIEDDILVTAQGHDNLTKDIPKAASDLERA